MSTDNWASLKGSLGMVECVERLYRNRYKIQRGLWTYSLSLRSVEACWHISKQLHMYFAYTCLYDIYLLAIFFCCRSWEKMRICYEELIGDCRLDPEAVSVLRAHIERFRVYSLPCRHQNPNQLHSQSPVDLLSRPYLYSVPLISIYNYQLFSKYFSRYFSDCFYSVFLLVILLLYISSYTNYFP